MSFGNQRGEVWIWYQSDRNSCERHGITPRNLLQTRIKESLKKSPCKQRNEALSLWWFSIIDYVMQRMNVVKYTQNNDVMKKETVTY